MELNLFEIIMYFITYSFLGWVVESVYRSINEKRFINTGFLIGPCCPIYGVGAIIMLLFLQKLEHRPITLFFTSIIILTIWEYLVGVMLEKLFKTKYWDYSNNKYNFQGRVCLKNSLYWGILGVLFIKYIHPYIYSLILKVDYTIINYVTLIFVIVFSVDMIASIIKVNNIKITLEKIDKINKEIREKILEVKNLTKRDITTEENLQKIIEELKNKRNRTIRKLYKYVYRLKKAFPAINTKEITEVLNQKIMMIKEKNKKMSNKKDKNA